MNYKRLFKYILFVLICLTVGITVNAEELKLGDKKVLIEKSPSYQDLGCTIIEEGTDSPITLGNNSTSYYVTYNRVTEGEGETKIRCTYKENGSYAEKNYTFQYSATTNSYYAEKAYNLGKTTNTTINLFSDLSMKSIVSLSFTENVEGILNYECSGTKCTITLSENCYEMEDLTIHGSVRYLRTISGNDYELETKLTILVNKNNPAYAVPTGYGTCGAFDTSTWTREEGHYKSMKVGPVSMPNCTPSTSYPFLEFAGWVKVTEKGNISAQTYNSCTNYNPQKGTINLEGGAYYFSCYKSAAGIMVYPSGNTLKDSSGWSKVGVGYYKAGSGTVTLPDVNLDGTFGKDKTFKGWQHSTTKEMKNAGDAVPADGSSYVAVYETTQVYRDYYKTIYIGETYHLTISEANVTGCTSADSGKVKTTGTGECLLTGVDVTTDPVEVIVVGDGDYQKAFHINVVSRTGMSETGDTGFIINIDPNVIASVTDSSTLNTYFVDSCELFEFDKAATLANGSTTDPSGTRLYNYKFKCTKGATDSFISYCLDAGRLSPKDGIEYVKSEQIDKNSDFGKLIGYMSKKGLLTGNMANVAEVTLLIRVVGIIDNIAIASDFNAGDESHAGSYSYYESIANRITTGGKIDPIKVAADSALSATAKDVLTNYQKENTSEALLFERTVDDMIYSDVAANGDYNVKYKGTMLVPGHGASLSGWSHGGFRGVVNKFTLSTDPAKQVPDRQVYEYEVTIYGNTNSSSLPTGTAALSMSEKSKDYSFKLSIAGAAGADAFIIEPTGRNASENYQRMLTINAGGSGTSDPAGDGYSYSGGGLTLYVYFSPAPNRDACGTGGLSLSNPSNQTLFRAAGCCNLLSVPQNVIDEVCTTTCTSTTVDPVCDYRGTYTGAGEYYEVVEGYKSSHYKIGGAEACIVETRNYGYGNDLKNHDSILTKYDDAGNSLMVDSYKNNRYCRVSCREEWGFGLDGYGSFTGENAIAAGSYFQLNGSDLFISGKRTCYTTFLNYGNTNTSREIGAGDSGFTKDVSDASDRLVNAYNGYSNLSHVYSDLACENDQTYSTSGGHVVKCDYSGIGGHSMKYCSDWVTENYCWTGSPDGACKFKKDAYHGYYCIDANGDGSTDSMDSSHNCYYDYSASSKWVCDYTENDGHCIHYSSSVAADPGTDGTCASGKYKYKKSDGTYSDKCYPSKSRRKVWYCNSGDGSPWSVNNNGTVTYWCRHKYKKDVYLCESDDMDLYTDLTDETYINLFQTAIDDHYEPKKALSDEMKDHGDGLYDLATRIRAGNLAQGLELENNNSQVSGKRNCEYKYDIRSYNRCTEYSICIYYSTATTNKIDDGDYSPDGAETGPGQYIKYTLDSVDGRLNGNSLAKGDPANYSRSGLMTTGKYSSAALTGYAYENEKQGKVECANDTGTTMNAGSGSGKHILKTRYMYRIGDDESAICHTESASLGTDGLSIGGSLEVTSPDGLASGWSNVILRDVGLNDVCKQSWPNCYVKQGSETKVIYTIGNASVSYFEGLGITAHSGTDGSESSAPSNGCGAGSCDTPRSQNVRRSLIEGLGIKGKLSGYASAMMAANASIITYAKDFYACQHFEMYNASDGQDNERKNNSLWTSKFMGTTRPFVRIVATYDPQISYTYDEKEYMTLIGNENVMERFNELNSSDTIFGSGCYNMASRSGSLDCYNNATNQKKSVYANGMNLYITRNYTENRYYNTNNVAWPDATGASYGGGGGTLMTCSGNDCNIGSQVSATSFHKRTVLCSIGLVNDEPITVSRGDMKSSSLTSVYINDKDFFWTAGSCFVNQVQYIKANYVSASIENSSFFKNKGYWYLNDGTDVKAHGDNLILALKNSNDLVKSRYDVNDKETTGQWSVLGDYNVFPIKMTTPRDLYEYTYTFSNIGSYSDGKTGRIMGNDQSLVAINSRTCFYEVFEEICLCCGNPLTAHTDREEIINVVGSNYQFSTENEPHSSTLTITSSTVSLSDVNSDGNRTLGSNWGNDSLFFYNGETFTTDKGAELLNYIQSATKGVNIYKDTPEYEFVINPNGMNLIREWNDQHGYQINFNVNNVDGSIVVPESRYAVTPYNKDTYLNCTSLDDASCKWDVPASTDEDDFAQNRIINFTHFKSKFLEDEIKGKVGISFTGRYSNYSIGMSEDCYVTTSTVSKLDEKAESCRWVDYIEETTNAKGDTMLFRLAYK